MTRPRNTTGGAFWGARPGYDYVSVPWVTNSRFAATRCYKGETLVDAMVQTRGQQAGETRLPPLSSSGSTLKHAISAPIAEHSAAIQAGGGSGREGPVSPLGAGSPTPVRVSVPMGVSVPPLGIVSHSGDGARMTRQP